MNEKLLNGEEAIAWGAISAGVKIVTGYPGSPGTEVMNCIFHNSEEYEITAEWSVNEKVAAEVAIGASIAGLRSLVCVKNVGLNAMLDPLMVLNLTPVNGGLVFLIGDDPGAYGSQNDQDSRPLVHLLEMPWIEPATAADGYKMALECFELSEKYQIPFFIRIIRAYGKEREEIEVKEIQHHHLSVPPEIKDRFIPNPSNSVSKHQVLRRILEKLKEEVTDSYCQVTGDGKLGIIASGHTYSKLLNVLQGENWSENLSILKLGMIYPLGQKAIMDFIKSVKHVLILEEHHPVLEMQIRSIVQIEGLQVPIHGKLDNSLVSTGEMFRWQIKRIVEQLSHGLKLNPNYSSENEEKERAKLKGHCSDCRYDEVLDMIDKICQSRKLKPFYFGDPGCLVTVTDRIHAKYAMGGAVALASGLSKAGTDRFAIALFGDSSFFHSAIGAICDASYHKAKILMILLDNGSALTTGGQAHPGTPEAIGNLSMSQIARQCGATIFEIELGSNDQHELMTKAIDEPGLRLVRVIIRNK